jgi:hypothetical protein
MPDGPDRTPWPREQTYLLVEIAEALDPDLPFLEWMALYRWSRPPATGRRDPDEGRYWGD